MVSFFKNCIEAIRTAPLFSAFDLPWQGLEHFGLTTKSVMIPEVDGSKEAIQQTVARLFCSFLAPSIAKPCATFNLGLGSLHLAWCLLHIQKMQDKVNGYDRKNLETALIRLATAVYDYVLMLLLCRPFPRLKNVSVSALGLVGFHLVLVPLFPGLTRQMHHLIFNNMDYLSLREGCLIKQVAKGVTDTLLPLSDDASRFLALPNALSQCSPSKRALGDR